MFRNILIFMSLVIGFSCNHKDSRDIAHIKFDFSGCFGSEKSTIAIKRQGDRLYAEYRLEEKLVKRVSIKESEMAFMNKFFKSLKNAREESGQCTTIQSCVASLDGKSVSKRNIDCDWNEYFTLKDRIFNL